MERGQKQVDWSSRAGGRGQNTLRKCSRGRGARRCLAAEQNPREALGLELVVKEGRDEKENGVQLEEDHQICLPYNLGTCPLPPYSSPSSPF